MRRRVGVGLLRPFNPNTQRDRDAFRPSQTPADRGEAFTPFPGGAASGQQRAGSSSSASPSAWSRPKRSHEAHTAAERAAHTRDVAYGKFRPLPELPWRRTNDKTFLDEAERRYGRKETWHAHPDPQVRMQLLRVLKAYIDRTLRQATVRYGTAKHYETKVTLGAALFRARVFAGLSEPATLRSWSQSVAAEGEQGPSSTLEEEEEAAGSPGGSGLDGVDPSTPLVGKEIDATAGSNEELQLQQQRRQRAAAAANLSGTVAEADDPFRADYSAFPFLRQRAVDGAGSLDPSLVNWAAKHFPDDDAKTFSAPPVPRGIAADGDAAADPPALPFVSSGPGGGARRQPRSGDGGLAASLDDVLGGKDVVADASGVYYTVRPFTGKDETSYGEQKLRRPRKARGGEVSPQVRKVGWETVALAKQVRKTPDVHRAKERLVRVTRGEDPAGVQ